MTGSHEDHGGNMGGHEDHGGSKPGIFQSITGQFTGGDHGGNHGIAPRTHRPSGWNRPPHHFDSHTYQHNMTARQRFHWHSYQRPHGWYDHRWVYGEIMPAFFWAQEYWITDWWMFDLPQPPYGYEWVQYGDDALLVNIYTGEILEVEYNLFD